MNTERHRDMSLVHRETRRQRHANRDTFLVHRDAQRHVSSTQRVMQTDTYLVQRQSGTSLVHIEADRDMLLVHRDMSLVHTEAQRHVSSTQACL